MPVGTSFCRRASSFGFFTKVVVGVVAVTVVVVEVLFVVDELFVVDVLSVVEVLFVVEAVLPVAVALLPFVFVLATVVVVFFGPPAAVVVLFGAFAVCGLPFEPAVWVTGFGLVAAFPPPCTAVVSGFLACPCPRPCAIRGAALVLRTKSSATNEVTYRMDALLGSSCAQWSRDPFINLCATSNCHEIKGISGIFLRRHRVKSSWYDVNGPGLTVLPRAVLSRSRDTGKGGQERCSLLSGLKKAPDFFFLIGTYSALEYRLNRSIFAEGTDTMLRQLNQKPTTRAAVTLVAFLSSVSLVLGQTKVVAPANKYSVKEDVQLGREAAREVEEQLPMLDDDRVDDYIENIGERLVAQIPAEFRHPEFRYSFDVVNLSDINAFALPGGPLYFNRGMIDAAKSEGEVAGVLAHEISHVALRHGTAQASKATKYEVGSILGQIAGAIIGGGLGQVVSGVTQFGLGTAFLRFGREFEKQADILGAQVMARAGYDPRDMANMFRTIQAKSGSGGPQWMSSHPNPGNRYEYISAEAKMLRVDNPIRNTQAFNEVKSRLARMAPAPTAEQVARQGKRQGGRRTSQGGGYPSDSRIGRVDPPSGRYQTYDEGDLFRVSVPSNWRELASNDSVTFAPEGAYGNYQGQSVFTHGVQIGVDRNEAHNLRTATDELIQGLRQGNPRLRSSGQYSNVTFAGRRGLHTLLSNVSDVTGQQERIALYTAQLSDGSLFYIVGVAPGAEFSSYQPVFNQVVRSIQLNDERRSSRR